ncbi:flagellar protein FlaG [Zhaonella formicivorans]|uniref:flagellar protein FlaG n=1 Tax=Zhaonella formicivorans TaxID=2528593 RepID=UPI0010D122FD|nr:flagellar protein FlaG [Zhaonella formicivorans]
MLTKIPGIDPIILNNVKERTSKQIVHDARSLKVTEHDEKGKGRQWHRDGKREELVLFLEELNAELEKENKPIRLYLLEESGRWYVQVTEFSTGKVVHRLSPRQAGLILGRNYQSKGFLLDEKA